ncbi:hypothetical protein REPUB_Repub08aG0017900 [Reevesia pubescens]
MDKLGCFIYVCGFIFFHLFQFGYGDVLEIPPFNINQLSLLKYLSLGDIKIDMPALYAFGDSFLDNGNTMALNNRTARLPYGIDFDGKPTGRFTNGRTVVDFIATVADLQYPPPILGMSETDRKTTRSGVNYGSASAGILTENGRAMNMKVINFCQQVDLFENTTIKDLKSSFNSSESFNQYLSKSVFFVNIATNDLGITYDTDMVKNYSDPSKYAEHLIEELSLQLQRLYTLGARKFLVSNVSPLGCTPIMLNMKKHTGQCVEEVNQRVSAYNKLLPNFLKKLQSTLSGSKFVLGDTYKVFEDVFASPSSYGFTDINTYCCTIRTGVCDEHVAACEDRKSHVFFDDHPTESMHFLLARRLLNDSSVCSPMTLIQLMQA